MAQAEDGTAAAAEEGSAAVPEEEAADRTSDADTVAQAEDGTADAAAEGSAAVPEEEAADQTADADTMAQAEDVTAAAAEDVLAAVPEEETMDTSAGTDTMARAEDGAGPAAEQGATAGQEDETDSGISDDGATESQDGDSAPDEGEDGAESENQLIIETRVVPDAPMDETQGPTAAPGVLEETMPGEEPDVAPIPPSFDTVRIKPDGSAVIAGRAEPGSEVTVRSGSTVLGSEPANRSGEWVLVPHFPIPPGDHEFSAIATLPDGTVVESEQVLIVSVPDLREDPGGSAFALLMPRDGEGKSTVLQEPPPAQEEIDVAAADEAPADESQPDVADVDQAPADEPQLDVAAVDETPADGVQPDEATMDLATLAREDPEETGRETPSEAVGETTESAPSEAVSEEVAPDASASGEDEGALQVGTVDYDEKGEMTIAGMADPDADLLVYLDERHVGTVESDATGEWEVTPDHEVGPGTYTLRVDQVDPAGVVLARIETPLTRARPEELSFGDAIVVVQPGNSLWRIARRTLGGGIHFTEIYEANRSQIADPALIYPGQIFTVPVLD